MRLVPLAKISCLILVCVSGIACIGGVGVPTLTEPADSATLSGDAVTLSWTEVESATRYKLEISRDEFFSSPAVNDDSITGISYLLDLGTFTSPLEGKETYYWHVAALAEGWGNFSETRSFYNNNQKRP